MDKAAFMPYSQLSKLKKKKEKKKLVLVLEEISKRKQSMIWTSVKFGKINELQHLLLLMIFH